MRFKSFIPELYISKKRRFTKQNFYTLSQNRIQTKGLVQG